MVAVGCLALLVFPILGLIAGGLLAGRSGAEWGAGLGLALALGLSGAMGWGLVKATRRD
jgi:hypothetical protein